MAINKANFKNANGNYEATNSLVDTLIDNLGDGGILESGEVVGRGRYVKFNDGTLVQFGLFYKEGIGFGINQGSFFRNVGSDIEVTTPIPFANTNFFVVAQMGGTSVNPFDPFTISQTINTTDDTFRAYALKETNTAASIGFRWLAIGRWK